MIPEAAVEAALSAIFPDETDIENLKDGFWLPAIKTILEAAAPHMLAGLTENSPRLPSAIRNVVFEAVFDVVDKFNFPAQNAGHLPDVVDIGDVCGDVEKRILAILRASAMRPTP